MANFPADPYRDYYLFAGYFVTQYARVEHTLRGGLRHLAGITEQQFKTLVGNPRSGDLVKKVKDLAAASEKLSEEAKSATKDAFDQLEHISKLRDRIVHYGSVPLSDGRTAVLTKGDAPTSLNHDETTSGNLWNAARDLDLINLVFSVRIHAMAEDLPTLPWNAVRQEPWLYKPL